VAGEVPDFDPIAWAEAIRRAYEVTQATLASAPVVQLGGVAVRDARGLQTPELPEVLASLGMAAIYEMPPPRTSVGIPVKVGIIGGGEGTLPGVAPIRAFLLELAPSWGLTGLYGDPVRGYAGGYWE